MTARIVAEDRGSLMRRASVAELTGCASSMKASTQCCKIARLRGSSCMGVLGTPRKTLETALRAVKAAYCPQPAQ